MNEMNTPNQINMYLNIHTITSVAMISLQHLILKPNELIKWNNNNNNHDDDEIEKEKEDNNLPRSTPNPHCLIFTFGVRNIPLKRKTVTKWEKKIVEIKGTVKIDLRKR